VAVKRLLPGMNLSERSRVRFRREVELLLSLRHPSIVTVFDFGETDGDPYYAMEFIDGMPLNEAPELIRPAESGQQAAHRDRVLATMAVIADAVAAFQQKGLIHRDLKPDNILMTADGSPRIVDFGLARLTLLSEGDRSTRTGEFLGTPAYASPEQFGGDPAAVDVRSDVYSLGVILFELLTGAMPIRMTGSLAESLRNLAEQTPTRPSALNPAIDRDTETIVLKCLAKEPARRYQSASELADDLRRRIEHRPIAARSDSAMYLLRSGLRRNKLLVTSVLTAAVLVLASSVITFVLWRQAVADRNVAQFEAYRSSLVAAGAAIREDRTQDALDMLVRAPKDLRGWEWNYVLSRVDDSVATQQLSKEAVLDVDWSDSSRALAFLQTTGEAGLCRFAETLEHEPGTVTMLPRSELAGTPRSVEWRPGRASLVVMHSPAAIREFDVEHQVWSEPVKISDSELLAAAWEADGNSMLVAVAAANDSSTILRWTPGDSEIAEIHSLPWRVAVLIAMPDDESCVAGGERWQRFVPGLSTDSTDVVADCELPFSVSCMVVAPDGQQLACGGRDGQLQIVSAATGERIREFTGHPGSVLTLAFSTDSQRLASGSRDSVVRLWNATTGEQLGRRRGHLHWIHGLRIRPDDRIESVCARGVLKQFVPEISSDDSTLTHHTTTISGLGFESHGATLVSSSMDGSVQSVSLRSLAETKRLHAGPVPVTAMSFDPADGSILAALQDGRVLKATTGISGLSSGTGQSSESDADATEVWRLPLQETSAILSLAQTAEHVVAGLESGEVLLLDRSTWSARSVARHERPVRFVTFALDASVVVSEDEAALRVTRVADGHVEWQPDRPRSLYYTPVAVDPAGERLAAGDSSGMIHIWNLRTHREEAPLTWHSSSVTAVCFHPDGTRLVSAATDGAMKVWDIERRQEVFALPDVNGFAVRLAFSHDGRRLAAGLYDGNVRVYEALQAGRRMTAEGP
jgi:WD40 repeat protein